MRRGVYVNLDNTNYNLDLHIFIAVQVNLNGSLSFVCNGEVF